MVPSLSSILSFLALFSFTFALQVSPNSTCAALCLDHPDGDFLDPAASTTSYTDITCRDGDYLTISTGIKFKNCVECLQNSKNVYDDENDINWFLYNIRYAVDVCLYGFPKSITNISSPCDINFACAPLQTALESGGLDPANNTQYGYCSADDAKFTGTGVDACIQCLQSTTDQVYISNFLIGLKAGCQQQPGPGHLLGLSGSLFVATAVNITDPPKDDTSNEPSNPMTTGAIVGIAIGAALLFLGGTALFLVYHRKQKAMYSEDFHTDFNHRNGSASITPPLKGGFNSVETKQLSMLSDYEIRAQQNYTNGQFYDKFEEEMRSRQPKYSFDPNNPGAGPQGALPTHPAYIPRAMSRNSNRSNRTTSPHRPVPVKSNKPDSYALQAYLAAAEESAALKIPPPPPRAAPGGPKSVAEDLLPHSEPLIEPVLHSKSFIRAERNAPPPPQPNHRKVPSLTLPSVPRIRVPKKYAPPSINVQLATPVYESNDDDAFAMNISEPIARSDSRFHEGPFAHVQNRNPSPDARSDTFLIQESVPVEQTIIDQRRVFGYEEVELKTGKSSIYG